MAFIKTQRIVRDETGVIISGSAAVVDTVYVRGERYHSKQEVRERLGKVIFLSEDGKSGLFMSPTRGFVEYNSRTDVFTPVNREDPRAESLPGVYPQTEIHTVFGDSYLLLKFLENCGLLAILQATFPGKEDFERVLAHVIHGIMRNGSKITCDNFIAKSFASYILDDIPVSSLRTDSAFFNMMGDDHVKMKFLGNFIAAMRKKIPDFGTGCYVDSTPLPNDIDDNPFDELCCHGISSSAMQMRLVLVLDEDTGLPVWYDIIPGNILDLSTIMSVLNDIGDNLDITVDSLVLDAGYASKNLIHAFHIGTEKSMICRMPARKGYPFKTLYDQVRPLIGKGKYAFVRRKHTYFGHRKKIELFDQPMYAYIYVDQQNALQRFRDYLTEHREEFDSMKNSEKDWFTVKFGYFVLLSNLEMTPANLLSAYFERTEIESVFKSCKEYLGLLPLRKWTDQTVRGKILHDTINLIALLNMRKMFLGSGISFSEISGKIQSLMCHRDNRGRVHVETPNKKTNEYYKLMGVSVPSMIRVDQFKKEVLGTSKM